MKIIQQNIRRAAAAVSVIAAAAGLAACGTPETYGNYNYPESGRGAGYSDASTGYPYAYNTYPNTTYPYNTYPASPTVEFGRVTDIALVSNGTAVVGGPPGPSGGGGAVAGAVIGGVLGNAIGHGAGRAAATILGAVGGAAVGNRLEHPRGTVAYGGPVYRVTVLSDSGVYRSYDVGNPGDLHPGDRVRVENGAIYLS